MQGVPGALIAFFEGWNDSLGQFWLSFTSFRTTAETVLTTLTSAAPVWGTTVITWVVQWVPVPIRLLFVFLLGTWVVGIIEAIVEWGTMHHYHKSFINAMGKRVAGFWTRGTS